MDRKVLSMNKDCFKSFPLLHTERLNIRAFREDDFKSYTAWYHGDILYYMMGLHYIQKDDIDAFKRLFLKNAPRMFETKESIIWCIAGKDSDQCIGKIELCKFDMNADSAEVGYCLSKCERGKGYMTEAVKAVIDWSFTALNINRIYAHVWDENKNSANILIKCGFRLEGILRENSANKYTINGDVIKDGGKNKCHTEERQSKDERIYGLLKSEFSCANVFDCTFIDKSIRL